MHQEHAVSYQVPVVPVQVPVVPFSLSAEQMGIFINWLAAYFRISINEIKIFIEENNINRCVLQAIFNCCGKIDTIPDDVRKIFSSCVIFNLNLVSMFVFKDSSVDDSAIDSLPIGEQFQFCNFVTKIQDQSRRFRIYSTILQVTQKFTVSGMCICSICDYE